MSQTMLRPLFVKVSVLGYFPLPRIIVYSSVSYTLIYILYTHIYIYYYIFKSLVYSMNFLLSTISIKMYIDNVNLI